MIVIVGGSGVLGRELTRRLVGKGALGACRQP